MFKKTFFFFIFFLILFQTGFILANCGSCPGDKEIYIETPHTSTPAQTSTVNSSPDTQKQSHGTTFIRNAGKSLLFNLLTKNKKKKNTAHYDDTDDTGVCKKCGTFVPAGWKKDCPICGGGIKPLKKKVESVPQQPEQPEESELPKVIEEPVKKPDDRIDRIHQILSVIRNQDNSTINISTAVCEEGEFRWKSGKSQKCSFIAPRSNKPDVKIEPQVSKGDHASKEVKKLLGQMGNMISSMMTANTLTGAAKSAVKGTVGGDTAAGLGGIVGGEVTKIDIPTSPAELPAAYASNALKMGQRLVDAVDRFAEESANKNVSVTATIILEKIEFECKPIDICEGGKWVDGGLWNTKPNISIHQVKTIGPFEATISEGFGGRVELKRALGRIQTSLKQMKFQEMCDLRAKFENSDNPCSVISCDSDQTGSDGGGVSGVSGQSAGDKCKQLAQQIENLKRQTEEMRKLAEEHRNLAEQARNRLSQTEEDYRKKLGDSQNREEDARREWRDAVSNERRLLNYGPSRFAPRSEIEEHNAKLKEAEKDTKSKSQELDVEIARTDDLRNNERREVNKLKEEERESESLAQKYSREATELSLQLGRLQREYDTNCKK